MSAASVKVPAIVASSLVCLLVGVGAGMVVMEFYGDRIKQWYGGDRPRVAEAAPEEQPAGGEPRPGVTRNPAMGRGAGGPRGGAGRTARGPSSKAQLAALVMKMDQLTGKPLALHLNAEQRKKVQAELKGLDEPKELSDEEAKRRLDALLEILSDQKETLETAGYRWPGQAGGGNRPAADAPNPFTEAANKQHLKSLEEQLAKGS